MDGDGVPWRDTMRPVRFYMIDARLLLFFAVWVFWPTWWTTGLTVAAMAAFRIAEARGYRLTSALRGLRAMAAGRRRPALHLDATRRFVDFG